VAESIIGLVIFLVVAAIIVYSLPYLIAGGIGYLLYKGTIWILKKLKGEVTPWDHSAGISLALFPPAELFYELRWISGYLVVLPLVYPTAWFIIHFTESLDVRSEGTMTPKENATPKNENEPKSKAGESPPPAPQGSPLEALYKELGEIMMVNNSSLLEQRLTALRRSMDATTYEKNVGAWLRKFKAGIEVMETMNKAERLNMDHEFMPLEREKKEAELKADIEHHKAREAEARMRQRMAHEE
jgi:hypothetical protein